MPVDIPPTIFKSGYAAAVMATAFAIMSFVAGDSSLNLFTSSVILFTICVTVGASVSAMEMPADSSVDFRIVNEPFVLSSIVSAMLFAAPSAFPSASSSFLMSFGLAFINARNPDIAFCPTKVRAAVVCSDSDRPLKAFRVS